MDATAPRNVPEGRFCSVREAALLLGVSERVIRRAVRRGLIPAVRLSRLIRIPRVALLAETKRDPSGATELEES